jgi:PBSX family phage terminase large subunit
MIIKPNPLPPFRILYDLPKGTWMVINMGGRGGGKSYEASKWGNIKATVERKRVAVLRDEKTTISDSILNELKNRYDELNEKSNGYFNTLFEFNSSELKELKTQKKLIFTKGFRASSGAKTANLKSISDVDIAIIEEFEDLTDEHAFNRFTDGIRNEGSLILINSNVPDMNHWFVRRYFDLDDTEHDGYFRLVPKTIPGVVYIFSTYEDNPHLPKHIVDKYNAYGDAASTFYDQHYYLTQILGLCSSGRSGQIYKNWKRITNDEFNELPYKSHFGLDYGWTDNEKASSGKMALVEVKVHNGKCYVRQVIYGNGYNKLTLAVKMIQLGITENDLIVADNAERITNLKLRNGFEKDEVDSELLERYPRLVSGAFNVVPCVKSRLSDRPLLVSQYEIYVTDDSTGIWNEYVNYSWAKDKNGNPTDEPEDAYNDAMDALSYILLAKGRLY